MPLSVGTKLGPYEILAPLGAGGMGEVYRARDTNLEREVAIKVLPAALAQDPERLARFKREAKVLASLNHHHIAQIYGVEDTALIMELVDGDQPRGPLSLGTVIRYARQIAEALEAAHEKGIVHRDIKPANIKVTPEGVVKVLDFGLAAVTPVSPTDSDPNKSPTMTMAATQAGMILGTAAYMSPEQAAGQPVDKRTDIWSFGAVLFELLVGHRLFEGETVSHTLAGVLAGVINYDQLPRETPAEIRALLRRCLNRNVKDRMRDIGEARITLGAVHAGETPLDGPATAESRRARLTRWVAAAAICLVVGAGAGYIWPHRPAVELHTTQFTVDAPGRSTFEDTFGGSTVSPDGRLLVFSARDNGAKRAVLWLRPIDSLGAHPLSGTEGGEFPFWSPDSQSLAFFTDGKLKRMAITGGAPVTLCEVKPPGPAGGAWNQDGLILFAGQDGLYRVPASGGVAARITQIEAEGHETGHGFPQFLPDGRRFLYYVQSPDPGLQGVYVAALDRPRERSRILGTDHKALYSRPHGNHLGLLLWLREHALLAQPFDTGKLKLEGEPTRVADNISIENTGTNAMAPSRAAFWLSEEGVLVYRADASANRKMLWVDRDGKPIQEVAEEDEYTSVRLSPDGKRAIVGRTEAADRKNDLWLLDLGRGVMTRFTVDGMETGFAVWSPDGRSVAYSSERKGVVTIYRKEVGGREEEQLTYGTEPSYVTGWSRDGHYLFCTRPRENGSDIWALPLDESDSRSVAQKLFLVVQIDTYGGSASFSPDGKWMTYHSAESGRTEIYARPFAGGSSVKTGKWQVSRQGGLSPRWRADGRELFYLSERSVMAATVRTASGNFESDAPHHLFGLRGGHDRAWDASADGQRFLVLEAGAADTVNASPLTVVVGWQAFLNK